MNTIKLCAIAIHVIAAHVPPLDKPWRCGTFTVADHDQFVIAGDAPRAWQVVVDAYGKPVSWKMDR